MAKKKTGSKQEGPEQGSQQKAGNDMMPTRPERAPGAKPPGISVELVTNLFKVSLTIQKSIYCHTIHIDLLQESPSFSPSQTGDAKKPLLPRKIPKDIRQTAVKNAVDTWIRNNHSKGGPEYSYVLDSNASTMYSLFRMLDVHDDSPGTRKHNEIIASVKSTRIVDKKAMEASEKMAVRFYAPSPVDVQGLIDHCAGRRPRENAEVEATLKCLNTILTGKILLAPDYLGVQAKTGSYSVFQFNNRNQFPISPGVFCNAGFISSVRITENGLVANVANSVVPFYEPLKVTDLLQKRFGVKELAQGLSPKVVDELKRELRLKQVEAVHINYGTKEKPHFRKYRVHDIGRSTTEEKFEWEENGKKTTISVFDYFKKEYPGCRLMYPKLPCIIDNKRKIPLEICRLVEKQKVNRRLTANETSEVLRKAAMKPEFHFKKVEQYAGDLKNHDAAFKNFGLDFDKKLIELKGRELPPIRLCGERRTTLNTRDGGYDGSKVKFVKCPKIPKWALVLLADEPFLRCFPKGKGECAQEARGFASKYVHAGRLKGVEISDLGPNDLHPIELGYNEPDDQIKKKLRQEFERLNKENYVHAIFVLPSIKDWIYGYMQYLEVDVPKKIKKTGICTKASRIKSENFVKKIVRGDQRSWSMFLANLWLKYNTKLGGVNYVLDSTQNFGIDPRDFKSFLADGYLFVSIDVCHPAPGDKLEQSVAAAVGLWNLTNPALSTCTRVRVQRKEASDKDKSTVEQVGEIGIMFEEILESYKKKTQKVPSHIVVLRDGVSDGQFHMVLQFELRQIKARIQTFYDKIKVKQPLLTCLTVQKRHRTRFMRKDPVRKPKGEDYNIQPGTVVDNTVVEPMCHSFYLAPHKAIQGTARAPHVYIIYDQIKFSQDSAQAMIFALSYLSPRCTKGTSIPTPVNLADLAAERGKHIVVSWNEDNPQRMSADERLISLNAFLSKMGDETYQDTLYYV